MAGRQCTILVGPKTMCGRAVDGLAPASVCTEHLVAIHRWMDAKVQAEAERQELRFDFRTEPFPCPTCDMLALHREIATDDRACEQCGARLSHEEYRQHVRDAASTVCPPVVYYIRFADRIKIGTTVNLPKRLSALPHDELLVTEPGDYRLEAVRHQQFAEHRVIGEWFRSAPELLAHIAMLRNQYSPDEAASLAYVDVADPDYPPSRGDPGAARGGDVADHGRSGA